MDWKKAATGLVLAAVAYVVIGAVSEFVSRRFRFNAVARLANVLDNVVPRLPTQTPPATTPTTEASS